MDAPMDTELPSSKLGTQAHWDDTYSKELEVFEDTGDEGEVWFGYDSIDRVADWMEENVQKDKSILDLGCGNGTLLIELKRREFHNLVGVDYSDSAIQLAKAVTSKEDMEIEYETGDILDNLSSTECQCLKKKYDILIDKGTYDAISLNPDQAQKNRNKYIENTHNLLTENGTYIITSCNWTAEELENHFQTKFQKIEQIPTPTFQFGGKTGNSVTSLIFKKKSDS